MDRPASPYDSHPPPAAPIFVTHAMRAAGAPETERDGRDAWSLLTGREALERQMTDRVRARLAARGIHMAVAP
jgi:hypothetical protein